MARIGMGIVGTGFIGPHHIDAVRRLGFVDVVAVAEANDELARAKAEALGVPKGYGSYEALLDDPACAGRPQRHAELPALSGERRRRLRPRASTSCPTSRSR